MKKALIYCRVSSQRQVDEGHGNESQEKRCRDYATNCGYKIEKVFIENGVSGGVLDRPTFNKLIEHLDKYKNNQYVVIFDDLKRFARKIEVHFQLKQEIIGRGSTVESPNFKFEDTPEGHFIEQIIAAQSELERNQNKRQVIQKMKARLEMGYWPFGPPPALKNKNIEGRGKVLYPIEPLASIYKDAIEKYVNDYLNSLSEVQSFICKKYKDIGLNKKISLNGTFNILTKELYYGLIQYKPWGMSLKKAQHDGFVAPELYQRVMNKYFGRSRPRPRTDYNPLFPLRGIILCSKCLKPMTGSRNKGRNTHYPNYWCKTKGCELHYKVIRNTVIHNEFEKLLENTKIPDEIVTLTKKIVTDSWNRKEDITIKDVSFKMKKIDEMDDYIKNAIDQMIKTKSEDVRKVCELKIDELTKEKRKLENELSLQPKFSQERLGIATKAVLDVLSKPLLMWKNEDQEIRKIIVFLYFDSRPVYDFEKGFGTNNLALPIKLMSDLSKGQLKRVDKIQNILNQIEAYVRKWYPLLRILNLSLSHRMI